MKKEIKVVEFYVLCNKLKNVIRTGWKEWGVEKERVESIAEHVYGTQMLAVAMWSEFNYKIDLKKVLAMLALHELEETKIGDLTPFQIDEKTKAEKGHQAVEQILSPLLKGNTIKDLILEFDERKTPEAKFARSCDKLEADLQCKLYDEANCVDYNRQLNNKILGNKHVKELLEQEKSWSKAWIRFGQEVHHYDENFLSISNYIKDHDLTK